MYASPLPPEADAVTLVKLVFEHFCERNSEYEPASISLRSLSALVLDIGVLCGSNPSRLIDAGPIFAHAKSLGAPAGLSFPDFLEALRLLSLPMFPQLDPSVAYSELLQVG
jgi:hypothetical protein